LSNLKINEILPEANTLTKKTRITIGSIQVIIVWILSMLVDDYFQINYSFYIESIIHLIIFWLLWLIIGEIFDILHKHFSINL